MIIPFFNSIIYILVYSSFFFAQPADSKNYEEIINESYTFDITDPTIRIDNRYGDIEISSHNQSTASLKVVITVEASSAQRADQIFDWIHIDRSHDKDYLSVTTEFKKGRKITKKNEHYTIDYFLSIPSKSLLKISNKYGDVSCADHSNNIELQLKHGSGQIQDLKGNLDAQLGYVTAFKIGSVSGNATLELSYSHISLDKAKKILFVSKYSSFELESADAFDSETKYDKLRIGRVRHFRNQGKYDNIKIQEVQDIKIETHYSHISIQQLVDKGVFNMKYGELKISKVSTDASLIDIHSHYTGCSLGLESPYDLVADTKYVDIDYPRDLNITNRVKDSNELSIIAYYLQSGGTKINAIMKYGHLKL